jgi:hypothetical protein
MRVSVFADSFRAAHGNHASSNFLFLLLRAYKHTRVGGVGARYNLHKYMYVCIHKHMSVQCRYKYLAACSCVRTTV